MGASILATTAQAVKFTNCDTSAHFLEQLNPAKPLTLQASI
jgi:hypothetical protein